MENQIVGVADQKGGQADGGHDVPSYSLFFVG